MFGDNSYALMRAKERSNNRVMIRSEQIILRIEHELSNPLSITPEFIVNRTETAVEVVSLGTGCKHHRSGAFVDWSRQRPSGTLSSSRAAGPRVNSIASAIRFWKSGNSRFELLRLGLSAIGPRYRRSFDRVTPGLTRMEPGTLIPREKTC